MLSEIVVALVVVAVAVLVAADAIKARSERPHPDADGYGNQAGRGATEIGHGRVPDVFADFGSPAAGPPAAVAGQPDAGPPAAGESARQDTGRRRVRSRLVLLAVVPALAGAIIALCVVRIAAVSPHHSGASAPVLAPAIAAAVVLVLALCVMVMTARSVLRPLYRLRARALAASGSAAADGAARKYAGDEIADIARAFDQMSGEITRLAGNEEDLRGKLDAMFVNLSQRGRSLAERQMRLVDSLQRREQDRDQLAGLTRLSRLAARMHRTSQNMLVLAGHEAPAGWNQPAPLADVIRTAVSEIEEHERITLYAQPDIAVSARAVGAVVNILAELIHNAASFSSADMPVEISSRLLNEGGVVIAVTDRGVGMTAKELAFANWQLEHPPGTEIDVPKSVGLIVVARLAARHGARLRLQHAEFGGLTALLWLPEEIITRQLAMPSRVPGAGLAGAGQPGAILAGAGRGAHAAVPGGVGAARPARFKAPADDVATGRRLVSEAGRRPGPVWPALGSQPAPGSSSGTASPAAASAPATALDGEQARAAAEPSPAGGRVVVPSAEPPDAMRRLPVFDSVETNWFGTDRSAPASEGTAPASASHWSSPGDEGWRAAQSVEAPVSGGSTATGLPRRLPNANLVPGAIKSAQPPELPARSAAAVRDRLARFQRGVSEGRAAASETGPDQGEQS